MNRPTLPLLHLPPPLSIYLSSFGPESVGLPLFCYIDLAQIPSSLDPAFEAFPLPSPNRAQLADLSSLPSSSLINHGSSRIDMARSVLSPSSGPLSTLPAEPFLSSRSATDEPALAAYYASRPIPETFEPGIVAASVLVSILGSYATLLLLGKRTSIRGTRNLVLLLAASVTFGVVGVWSMHFVSSARPFSLSLSRLLPNRLSSLFSLGAWGYM